MKKYIFLLLLLVPFLAKAQKNFYTSAPPGTNPFSSTTRIGLGTTDSLNTFWFSYNGHFYNIPTAVQGATGSFIKNTTILQIGANFNVDGTGRSLLGYSIGDSTSTFKTRFDIFQKVDGRGGKATFGYSGNDGGGAYISTQTQGDTSTTRAIYVLRNYTRPTYTDDGGLNRHFIPVIDTYVGATLDSLTHTLTITGGGGGGTTIYTGDSTLTSNRIVGLNGHSLSFQDTSGSQKIAISPTSATINLNVAKNNSTIHIWTQNEALTQSAQINLTGGSAEGDIQLRTQDTLSDGSTAYQLFRIHPGNGYLMDNPVDGLGANYSTHIDTAASVAIFGDLFIPDLGVVKRLIAAGGGGVDSTKFIQNQDVAPQPGSSAWLTNDFTLSSDPTLTHDFSQMFSTEFITQHGPDTLAVLQPGQLELLVNNHQIFSASQNSDGKRGAILEGDSVIRVLHTLISYTGANFNTFTDSTLITKAYAIHLIDSLASGGGSGTVTSITPGIGFASHTPITTSGTMNVDTASVVQTIANFHSLGNTFWVPLARTVAGFALSSNVTLGTLTIGNGLLGTSYNPSGATTIKADTSVLRTVANSLSLSAAQTKFNLKLNISDTSSMLSNVVHKSGNETIGGNKTFSSTVTLTGGANFGTGAANFTNAGNVGGIVAGTLTAGRTYTLPDKSGTFAMLSDISGGSGTVTSITPGWSFTSSTPITTTGTLTEDSTKVQTVANFFPKGDTRWAKTSSLPSFSNGLTLASGVVKLGGTLTGATTIDATNQDMVSEGENSTNNWKIEGLSPGTTSASTITIQAQKISTSEGGKISVTNNNLNFGYTNSSGLSNGLLFNSTVTLTDGIGNQGILYGGLYEANFTGRSLVTKRYTDSTAKTKADSIKATISGGAVSSVTNSDGSLIISPTTGSVAASLNPANANVFTALQTMSLPSTGITNADGILIKTSTAATTGARIQYSPIFDQEGNAWNTTTSTSQPVNFFSDVEPTSGNPIGGTWVMYGSVNGGAANTIFTMDNFGDVAFYNTFFQNKNTGGAVSSDGYVFQNQATSSTGTPVQYSTRLRFNAHVRNTTTSADNQMDFIQEMRPVSGTAPTGKLFWAGRESVSGTGSFVDVMSLDNSGNLRASTLTSSPLSLSAINSTATITAAQLAVGVITSTSASATTGTLPTATLMATQIGGVQGTKFPFTVDNHAGANIFTVAVGTGITAATGSTLTVAAGQIRTFELYFTSTTTAILLNTF